MSYLTLYKPLIDWVTLTGHAHVEIVEAFNKFMESSGEAVTERRSKKWQQFKGEIWSMGSGKAFAGMGEIKGVDYMAVWVSGEAAQEALGAFYPLIDREIVRVTRIDLQATIEQPADWEQIRFANRMHARGKVPDLAQSTDQHSKKTLATVAIGSRSSESYARVYEKLTDGGERLLRFEGEYKGAKARAIVEALKEATPGAMLLHHVQKLRDEKLEKAFSLAFAGVSPHNARPKVKTRDKKREWLLLSVLPSFAEYVNSHEDDGEVVSAFLAVLEDFC